MEFRKSIINYNELTRGYVHIVYSVGKMKNFDREIKNGDCFKIVNFRFFFDFWIAISDLETCMHGSNFFYPTRPGPVRSQSVQLCICVYVYSCVYTHFRRVMLT